MPLDFTALDNEPRLLIEVPLKPVQGSRFQPTGFPDLGAATFTGIRFDDAGQGSEYNALLVESTQSMANRLEEVCWDHNADNSKGGFIAPLNGVPFVRTTLPDGRVVSSITESHRLNSPYFQASQFQADLVSAVNYGKGKPWRVNDLARFLFSRDPNSLIHGVFFSSIHDGRMRLPRVLSAFIEAELPANGSGYAESGFTRKEDADPSGEVGAKFLDGVPDAVFKGLGYDKPGEYRGKLKENVKNIPGAITEFTATSIKAHFMIDLAQIRGFGLPDDSQRFLIAFGLFKILAFLRRDLRLRSRCTFEVAGTTQLRPKNFAVPSYEDISTEMATYINEAGFPKDRRITEVVFPTGSKQIEVEWPSSVQFDSKQVLPDGVRFQRATKKKTARLAIEHNEATLAAAKAVFVGNDEIVQAIDSEIAKLKTSGGDGQSGEKAE